MLLLIFSLVFFFFVALAILIGALRGRKYKWQLSVSRMILSLASALVAYPDAASLASCASVAED